MEKLRLRAVLRLRPFLPFHFVGTVHKPSHFPSPTDVFDGSTYYGTMRWLGMAIGITLEQMGNEVEARIFAGRALTAEERVNLAEEIRHRFAMNLDLTDFCEIARLDKQLRPVMERWKGMRQSCAGSLYELLCIAVVLQNAAVNRSVNMLESMLRQYGTEVTFAGKRLFAFWEASTLAGASESQLRSLKVGYRATAFLELSRFFARCPQFETRLRRLPKDAAARQLRRIYGVGPATAWYLLFESLKHPDAFDHVSPWETKILSRLMFGQASVRPERILAEAQRRWGCWRMLAVHYLFEDLFWQHQTESVPWLADLGVLTKPIESPTVRSCKQL